MIFPQSNKFKLFVWLPLAAFLFCSCRQAKFPDHPRLIVFIVIDQLSGELFQRVEHEFSGGFKWLLEHGYHFTHTYHEHGYTVTGTGHFALASGRYPGPAGILGNSWYNRNINRTQNCVEDTLAAPVGGKGAARSYRFIHSTAIGDWILEGLPDAKVFTVAGKDRAAVFMGGKHPDLAIYYDWTGSFMTSDYYANELPSWLKQFNEQLDFTAFRDSIWDHVKNDKFYSKYGTADHQVGEEDLFNTEVYSPTLPISLSDIASEKTNEYIGATPWFDQTVLSLSLELIRNEQLGVDQNTDFLAIGISAADWIGHSFGPHSHEVLDYFIRLDEYLMQFFQKLDQETGLENILFVLSSDHGSTPLPEYVLSKGIEAGRLNDAEFISHVRKIEEWSKGLIKFHGHGLYFPQNYSEQDKKSAYNQIKKEFVEIKAIEKWMTKEEILTATGNDPMSSRLKNMIHPTDSPDIVLIMKENYIAKYPYGTTHGTPYNYDAHVPLIIAHENVRPKRVNRHISTVDIAPTIAKLAGVQYPQEVDGIPLKEITP